jgi:hypothetical protein
LGKALKRLLKFHGGWGLWFYGQVSNLRGGRKMRLTNRNLPLLFLQKGSGKVELVCSPRQYGPGQGSPARGRSLVGSFAGWLVGSFPGPGGEGCCGESWVSGGFG